MNKKIIAIISLLFTFFAGFAQTSFNSFTGFSLDFSNKGVVPAISFAAQYSINNTFTAKGHFTVKADENIFADGIFQDTDASFSINELSATYRFLTLNFNHQINVFIGNFESFGSDAFVKKYFGAENFISPVLSSSTEQYTAGMFEFSRIGFSYALKFPSQKAFSFYTYYDKKNGDKLLNADFRFAAVWDSIILDADIGTSFPLLTKYNDEDVLLLIETAKLRAGFSLLLGNNPITNLFLQAGLSDIDIKAPKAGLENLYLFMEPRFTTKHLKCSVAFYNLPENEIEKIQFLENPLGCNISLASQPFILFENKADAGCYITLSANLDNFELKIESSSIQISPYLNMELLNGVFSIYTKFQPFNMTNPNFFTLSLGYKNYL